MESFTTKGLIGQLKAVAEQHPDTRRGNNLIYPMKDAVLGALSIFFMQSPSFLAGQRILEETQGRSNAQSLFGLVTIPSDNQIRNLLDEISQEIFHPVFRYCVEGLKEADILDSFRMAEGGTLMGNLVIALDGTGYYSSQKIHCDNCTIKKREKGTDKEKTYYEHSILTPVIVSPQTTEVIPLEPEYILPQDGELKQDCENKAAKRWIEKHGEYYKQYEVTIVGDDLYAHQPLCLTVLGKHYHFILVCKPDSHVYLYQWVEELEEGKDKSTITIKSWDEKEHRHSLSTYHYANHVPIRDSDDALFVNFVEVTIVEEKTGKVLYHNAFITDHQITNETVEAIVTAGRARWNIENGNNNTLKTKGYHFEHSYGHGKKNLSMVLTTLIILAFLFHTMLHFADAAYQRLREILPRQLFFQHIQALTSYLYFDNWDHLFRFMEEGRKKRFAISELTSMLLNPAPG
jgi:Transposase DDE domain